ncbi:MAG: phosphoribosylaminoimidazolesuccinocarboxamide synthase [Acidobacteria bacterium]|nr:MAG: phosphoribosylaminoimidazolesuccinocarboxamide synthase [Acidobacteriota bacterium]REK10393.1 MAG: phosphoribosylaminoimidazolesuccinocarboxamide synthase [Acidobacteriota bacterium]
MNESAPGQSALVRTQLDDVGAVKRGKVRDLYDLGDRLLVVATDRLSAYDHVLSPGIPDKGKVLNQLTNFWFSSTREIVPNHLLATRVEEFPEALQPYAEQLAGRSVIAAKAEVVPFECVARGYLAGSAFREYSRTGSACGYSLPEGLVRASRLDEPLFTPATKAESGHDENISYAELVDRAGSELAERLRDVTLELYQHGRDLAAERGLILADTKFEFGWIDGELTLIDEVLTPDSSRYWEVDAWSPGTEPVSFDKQFVRNWLDESGWDHDSPPPDLPGHVVAGTRDRYLTAFRRITGSDPEL